MAVITDIVTQKRNKERFSIFIDNEYSFSASAYVVSKYKLSINNEVEKEYIEKICFEEDLEKAKSYILDYYLNKTEYQVIEKLKSKGYSDDVISAVNEFLKKYNIINDEDYAKRYAHDYFYIKKQGINIIRNKLVQKGVNKQIIEDILKPLKNDEYEILESIISKIIKKVSSKAKSLNQLKSYVYQQCIQKGYSGDVIQLIISEINLEEYLSEKVENDDEIKKYYDKVYEKYNKNSKNTSHLKSKLFQYLLSKGFSNEKVSNFLENHLIIPED